MKRIAVGVDFSPESSLAARQDRIARHVGGEAVPVHAQLLIELPPVAGEPNVQVVPALDSYRSRAAREVERSREMDRRNLDTGPP